MDGHALVVHGCLSLGEQDGRSLGRKTHGKEIEEKMKIRWVLRK